MDKQKINEAISSWFEPTPDRLITETGMSVKGAWWFGYRAKEDEPGIHSLDYFTDEAANARLLEAMPKPMLQKGLDEWFCYAHKNGSVRAGDIPRGKHQDRKTAVVLAFCKFAGIKTGI
jgi:hypothetical protein